MPAKKTDTNCADPDQTAFEDAVWSGSSLFAILTSRHDINLHFIWEQKEKIVRNFRIYTILTKPLNRYFYKTVKTQIKCCIKRHFIRFFTVCQGKKRSSDKNIHFKVNWAKGFRWAYRMGLEPACVHTFKHEYFWDQLVDHNQISSGASLGWGIGCIRFWARSDLWFPWQKISPMWL